MPTVSDQLAQIAVQTMNDLEPVKKAVQVHVADAEAVLTMWTERLDELEKSRSRQATFEPRREDNYQCPRCWVLSGKRSNLKPVAPGAIGYTQPDQFVCISCRFDASFLP
jgi:hypothetical protein